MTWPAAEPRIPIIFRQMVNLLMDIDNILSLLLHSFRVKSIKRLPFFHKMLSRNILKVTQKTYGVTDALVWLVHCCDVAYSFICFCAYFHVSYNSWKLSKLLLFFRNIRNMVIWAANNEITIVFLSQTTRIYFIYIWIVIIPIDVQIIKSFQFTTCCVRFFQMFIHMFPSI